MSTGYDTMFAAFEPHRARMLEMPVEALLMRFRDAVEVVDYRVFEMENEPLDRAWPGGELGRWSIRTILGHLADCELVQTFRMRRALAEDNPVAMTWDEDAFVDSGIYGAAGVGGAGGGHLEITRPPIGAFVATVHTLRLWTATTLMLAGRDALERRTMHPEFGALRVLDMLAFDTWHFEHHAGFLNRKAESVLGPMPEPEPCSDQGCARPGCACGPGE